MMCITKHRTGIFKLHTLFYNDNSYFLYMCGIYFYITYFIWHYYLGHHTYCHSCQPYSGLFWTPIIPAKATNRTPAYIEPQPYSGLLQLPTVLWPTLAPLPVAMDTRVRSANRVNESPVNNISTSRIFATPINRFSLHECVVYYLVM